MKLNKAIIKFLILVGVLLIITISIFFFMSKNRIAVLGYHSFTKESESNSILTMTSENFEKQMKYLHDHKYKSLTLEEFECWKNKTCKQPIKSVLITMDDGYTNNYEIAFPILKKYNMKAVVFVIGEYLNYDGNGYFNIDLINKSKNEYPNIEFASHSYGLHYKYDGSEEQLQNDIKEMENYISSRYYAYPRGEFNDTYKAVLKKNGYKLGFAFGNAVKFRKAKKDDDNYEIARLSMDSSMPIWKFKLRMILPM